MYLTRSGNYKLQWVPSHQEECWQDQVDILFKPSCVLSKYRIRGASPIFLFYFAKALWDDNCGLNFRKKEMFDHWPGHNRTLFWL